MNFLCYTDKTFEFGPTGLTLISGNSGTGKTSILRGIFFALFGEGNKVQSYGKTSASVELDFGSLKIIRTKRPNRLVVNEEYEDAVAQEIILKEIGENFKVAGYIQQNNLYSFILKSPTEKLDILEGFACRDVNIAKLKSRLKTETMTARDELVSTESRLEMSKERLERLAFPKEVKFPIKCRKAQRALAIKNESVKFKNARIRELKATKAKEIVQSELNATQVLEGSLETLYEQLHSLDSKIKVTLAKLDLVTFDGDESLQKAEFQLEQWEAHKELIELRKQYEMDKQRLAEVKEKELELLETALEEEKCLAYTEHSQDELEEMIEDLQACLVDLTKLERLKAELADVQILENNLSAQKEQLQTVILEYEETKALQRKLEAQKNTYYCPSCSVPLKLQDEALVEAVDLVETELGLDEVIEKVTQLSRELRKARKAVSAGELELDQAKDKQIKIDVITSQYEELPDSSQTVRGDLDYMLEYKRGEEAREKKISRLTKDIDNEIFSASYHSLERRVNTNLSKIEGISTISPNVCPEALRTKVQDQREAKRTFSRLSNEKLDLEKETQSYQKVIDKKIGSHQNRYGQRRNVSELEDLVSTHQATVQEQQRIKEKSIFTQRQIEKWEIYTRELKEYNDCERQVSTLGDCEQELRKKYGSYLALKAKILEAESLAMLNIIEIINNHARTYLDAFFPEHPIIVQLQPFKTTKKSIKPSINVAVDYKGMECTLATLSGGELSRVVLAFTLALAEMFNSPLLLLDECTASLDQEMTSVVFDGIRENFNGQLVLIIAHQVISGTFDQVVKL